VLARGIAVTEKTIAIIGAGLAGLAAGCYARLNGYRSVIFEAHDKPGGLCTSWPRGDYTFDGCVHWLVGSRPGSAFHTVWEELGAVQGRPIVDHEEFMHIEDGERRFVLYSDIERLAAHMRALAPQDARAIAGFARDLHRLSRFRLPIEKPNELYGWRDALRMVPRLLPVLGLFARLGRLSIEDYARRFRDPFLRAAFTRVFRATDFPVLAAMMTFAWMHNRDAGYPVGGSLALARAIERRHAALGGEIHYRSRVERVLVENGRAVGVRLADGGVRHADWVLSAADGHATIFELLEGRFVDDTLRGRYERLPPFRPRLNLVLGVARDLRAAPHALVYRLRRPLAIAGETHEHLSVFHYGFDPTLAPAGKTLVSAIVPTDYDWWMDLYRDRERYQREKRATIEALVAALEERFPGIGADIEVMDLVTPITYRHFTGNWRASPQGWQLTTETFRIALRGGMRKTLPGLAGFYMAGQWVEPGGGLPTAAKSGRDAIQLICRDDGRRFRADRAPD
jgi:phytoene dehydrogenase-like protein